MTASITIIGMGACGVAAFAEATIRLAASPVPGLSFDLVERDDDLGPGLAFGTDQPGHLLNTESRLMGLYAHEPEDFRDWLSTRRPLAPGAAEYAPRAEYGEYIRGVFADALRRAEESGVPVRIHRGEAVAVEGTRDNARVRLGNGTLIASDYILLALGTPKPRCFEHLDGCPGYIDFPWPAARLRDGIDRDADVIVLGSSLSAIDTLATLLDERHRGHIHFVSREGMLPRVEIPAPEAVFERRHFTLAAMHRKMRQRGARFSIVDLFRLFRREAEEASASPIDWCAEDRLGGDALAALDIDIARAEAHTELFQRILTAARYEASEMWDLLSPRDRTRFARWLGPHFATARFTMPIVNARRIAAAGARGQLRIHGGVERTEWDDIAQAFVATFSDGKTLQAPIVVNATGTAMRLQEIPDALVGDLVTRGWLHSHPSGGVEAHRHSGAVITRDRAAPRLYAIGQLVNGVQRDTNAVWFNVACAERAVQDMLAKIAGSRE